MNISGENLAANFGRRLKTAAVVFSTLLIFGAAVDAQSINDDLKPKTTVPKAKIIAPKPKAAIKAPAKSSPKKVTRPKQSVSKTNSAGRVNPIKKVETVSYSSETPDQIINRFMSFRQSSGVTDRDWRSVIAQTTKTLQSNSNNATAKAQSLIAQGQLAYNQRDYAMAVVHFKSILKILPRSSLPRYSLGKTYLANGQASAAERFFKQAIEENENFALAYKGMGDALTAQGDTKKATKYFRKATEISVRDGNTPL